MVTSKSFVWSDAATKSLPTLIAYLMSGKFTDSNFTKLCLYIKFSWSSLQKGMKKDREIGEQAKSKKKGNIKYTINTEKL